MWNLTPSSKAIEKWQYIPSDKLLALVYKSKPNSVYFYAVSQEDMDKLTPDSSIGSFFSKLTKTKTFLKLDIEQ